MAMEFNEVINKRKTSREFTNKEVDFEAIKSILEQYDTYPEKQMYMGKW
jgi:hypothetical protein